MWKRKELKTKAKASLSRNYWGAVLGGVVSSLFVASAAITSSSSGDELSEQVTRHFETEDPMVILTILAVALGVLAVALVVSSLFKILVCNPFEVGVARFFTRQSREDKTPAGELLAGFKNGYGRNVLAIFLRDLFIALWSLLFVIPGIIKAFQWLMVPYILADDPGVSAREARVRSKKLMEGSKWKAFVLMLSFIGWYLLSALTAGLLGLFYVNPYAELTWAELYLALKEGEQQGMAI